MHEYLPLHTAPALLVPLQSPLVLCVQWSIDDSFPPQFREKSEVLREERERWTPATATAPADGDKTKQTHDDAGVILQQMYVLIFNPERVIDRL